MKSGPITSWQIDGEKVETVTYFILLVSKITAGSDCSHKIKRRLLLERKTITNLESESEVTQSCPTLCNRMDYSLPGSSVQAKQHMKKQRLYFANKGLSSQSYGFSSSNVRMGELDHKES